jgi:hypothetical protein
MTNSTIRGLVLIGAAGFLSSCAYVTRADAIASSENCLVVTEGGERGRYDITLVENDPSSYRARECEIAEGLAISTVAEPEARLSAILIPAEALKAAAEKCSQQELEDSYDMRAITSHLRRTPDCKIDDNQIRKLAKAQDFYVESNLNPSKRAFLPNEPGREASRLFDLFAIPKPSVVLLGTYFGEMGKLSLVCSSIGLNLDSNEDIVQIIEECVNGVDKV